jgi:hypothetical protein
VLLADLNKGKSKNTTHPLIIASPVPSQLARLSPPHAIFGMQLFTHLHDVCHSVCITGKPEVTARWAKIRHGKDCRQSTPELLQLENHTKKDD